MINPEIDKVFPIWLIWEDWRTARGNRMLILRGVTSSLENAKGRIIGIKREPELNGIRIKVWVEENLANHLFGHEDYVAINMVMRRK